MSSDRESGSSGEGEAAAQFGIVGILGGMGPLATVDFMRKVVAHTPSRTDQDHVPVVIASIPQIPDRTAAFKGTGPSPLEALVCSGRRLIEAGAELIVMPCNTAHLWYSDIQRALGTPMLHIVDAALADVWKAKGRHTRVGLLATEATVASGLYEQRAAVTAERHQLEWILPTDFEMQAWIAPAILGVKAGDTAEASNYLVQASNALVERGASLIVMGCTEIPLALQQREVGVPLVDATDALARRLVKWAMKARAPV